MTNFNDEIIAEFRANSGTVTTYGFGRDLVLIHNIGAKSGAAHISPVLGIREGTDAWLVAASAAGAPRHPAWYHNLMAHPDVDLEFATEESTETVPVHVTDLRGADRDEAWTTFTTRSPGFKDYEKRTTRVIPVLRLTRR